MVLLCSGDAILSTKNIFPWLTAACYHKTLLSFNRLEIIPYLFQLISFTPSIRMGFAYRSQLTLAPIRFLTADILSQNQQCQGLLLTCQWLVLPSANVAQPALSSLTVILYFLALGHTAPHIHRMRRFMNNATFCRAQLPRGKVAENNVLGCSYRFWEVQVI